MHPLITLSWHQPLKTPPAISETTSESWSRRFSERYGIHLDSVLSDWLDREVWRFQGTGEFSQPVAIDVMLAAVPEVIWPGLMLPDTLPIIGNRQGDWLCLRVGADNRVSEVVHWYHGGGDWIPWGKNLAEAVTFDAVRDRLPGRRQSHAIAAEPQSQASLADPLIQWAIQWSRPQILVAAEQHDHHGLVQAMLAADVASVAVNCELALEALDSDFRRAFTAELAADVGVDWEPDAISLLFDNDRIDSRLKRAIDERIGRELLLDQDWELAAKHCQAVAGLRTDLGWAFDVAGWQAEKSGNPAAALMLYSQGVTAMAFADQAIRFRTHWYPQPVGKFSAWRFGQLLKEHHDLKDVDKQVKEFAELLLMSSSTNIRAASTKYWNAAGNKALEREDWNSAYNAFYRGGWDLGIDRLINYRGQLKSLIEAAEKANQRARALVARTHYEALCDRFGEN